MKKILLSLVVAISMMFAGQGDYKSELSVTAGGVMPEGNLDLEDQLNLGLRFGVYVEDKIFDMVEAGFERASSADYENSNEDTNINRFFVNVIKEYDLSKETALYGLVGVGFENYRNPQFDNDDDGFVQYGVGVKQWLTENFALKAEVRHGITFDGDNNLFYNLGFVVPFGKKVQEEMPIKSEPVVMPKKATPKDDDRDGVTNANDKCPNTPEAITVDANGCAYDNDKDGVINEYDRCMTTPEGITVNESGCAYDDDRDGVINEYDRCMTTPAGRVVDESGCMLIVALHVNFATNKADVVSDYNGKIQEVVDFMNDNKSYEVTLSGHTDSVGSLKNNQALSERRAVAVANVLTQKGINAKRISSIGYGESKPTATNDTEDGRAKNRRVEASFNK